MSVVTISEILKAFSTALESVDLRVVTVKPENQWINVITSMFLSCKSLEKTESEQQQARDACMHRMTESKWN